MGANRGSSRYALLIAYEGSEYNGWQIQPEGVGVQQLIEEALALLVRGAIRVIGASRTDAGVHALGQVAHFSTPVYVEPARWMRSLNGILPDRVRVRALVPVPTGFHAQQSAVSKLYHYRLCIAPSENPLERHRRLFIPYSLDLEAMRRAAALLIGERDFSSFANHADRGSAGKNPVRNLLDLRLEEGREELLMAFEGNGFLYKMVRNIVGTLLEVGRGKRSAESMLDVLTARDRRKAAAAAPPHGLTLVEVRYPFGVIQPELRQSVRRHHI